MAGHAPSGSLGAPPGGQKGFGGGVRQPSMGMPPGGGVSMPPSYGPPGGGMGAPPARMPPMGGGYGGTPTGGVRAPNSGLIQNGARQAPGPGAPMGRVDGSVKF